MLVNVPSNCSLRESKSLLSIIRDKILFLPGNEKLYCFKFILKYIHVITKAK